MGRFIGKTKKIDMAYTREYGVVKALVKVVDIASIPYKKLIFHEDEGYYLTFEIEEEVDMVEDDDPTNGDDKDFNSREKEQEKRKDPKGDNSKNGNSSREPQPKNDFPMSGGNGGSDVNKGARTAALQTLPDLAPCSVVEEGFEKITGSTPTPISIQRLYISPSTKQNGCALVVDDGDGVGLPRTIGSDLLQSTSITDGVTTLIPSPAEPGKLRVMAAAAAAADLLPAFSSTSIRAGKVLVRIFFP
jgi:hypothetical protein